MGFLNSGTAWKKCLAWVRLNFNYIFEQGKSEVYLLHAIFFHFKVDPTFMTNFPRHLRAIVQMTGKIHIKTF